MLTVVRVAENEKPVANSQTVSVTEDGRVDITLSGSDEETVEGNLTFRITSQPTCGSLSYRITHTADGTSLLVTINGAVVSSDIPLTAIAEIRAWGRAGNDRIELIDLAINSLLDGGTGDDEIIGAAGHDLIFGGDGNDLLTGAAGNDFLIGGTGADRIVGSAGHDILVAGGVACHFTDDDLRLIALEWASDRTTDDGLEEDVLDETSDGVDVLTGSSGADWFIISNGDMVTDFKIGNKDGDMITANV